MFTYLALTKEALPRRYFLIMIFIDFHYRHHVHGALRTSGELMRPLTHIFGNMGKAYGLRAIPNECPRGMNFMFI